MTEEQKLDQIAEIFEVNGLAPETQLSSLNWDSMAMLSVIAFARQNGKVLTTAQIRDMKTVSDILSVL